MINVAQYSSFLPFVLRFLGKNMNKGGWTLQEIQELDTVIFFIGDPGEDGRSISKDGLSVITYAKSNMYVPIILVLINGPDWIFRKKEYWQKSVSISENACHHSL
jgi:hypothetical protein